MSVGEGGARCNLPAVSFPRCPAVAPPFPCGQVVAKSQNQEQKQDVASWKGSIKTGEFIMYDKKRRHGPEPKSEEEKRNIRTGIYFNKSEYAILIKKAFPHGCAELSDLAIKRRIGSFIRNVIIDAIPPSIPAINSDAWVQLSKANSNLNQVMQIANKFGDNESFDTALEVKKSVDELRYKLLGITFDIDELEVDDES